MALFADEDLQDFADLAEELAAKDDCEILEELPLALDSTGGHDTAWPVKVDFTQWPIRETVKCIVAYDTSPQLYGAAQQKVQRVPNKISLPRGTQVDELKNRLRVNGVTYVITGIPDPTSYEIFRTCHVSKLPLQGSAP